MDRSLSSRWEGVNKCVHSCSSAGLTESLREFVTPNSPVYKSFCSVDRNISHEEELFTLENTRLYFMEDEEDLDPNIINNNNIRPNVCRSSNANGPRHNARGKRDTRYSVSQDKFIENGYSNGYLIEDHLLDDDEPLLGVVEFNGEGSDHCHVFQPSKEKVNKAKRQLMFSSCMCFCFMLVEFLGGYFANSLAIMTDAAHLLSDLASFSISLFALWVGQKHPTKRMSFGYYRAEILGAVASVFIIWVLTGVLVYMAINRVRFQNYEIDTDVMLIVSGCGVAMNIIMGLVLHGSSSSHNHSHGSNSSSTGNSQNINVRAAFIHVLGDLVQSTGVLIAAYIIHFKPEYNLADPICTFIFSVLVFFTTLTIMRDAIHVLMEGFPRDMNYAVIKSNLQSIEGVETAHSLHIWSLTVDKNALAVHLAIDPEFDPHVVLKTAESLMRRKYGIYHTTIQVEKYDASTMLSCYTCQGPKH